jgi:hypothetical protein
MNISDRHLQILDTFDAELELVKVALLRAALLALVARGAVLVAAHELLLYQSLYGSVRALPEFFFQVRYEQFVEPDIRS